ncbi:MAG TPA: TIGR04282 family arsenosugar biosynthesis glycosyltransferase [Casimicrobiaceae bacterium]|nr:TIGR04282 family arsenosugar biosynthesis glycosyltransferase [Casimicrobiaceae bacterium]
MIAPTLDAPDRRHAVQVALFARAPIPGEAKTRLAARMGIEGAARLQELLIEHALRTAVDAALAPVSLWCTPTTAHPAFAQARDRYGATLHEQCAGDLGARMSHAFSVLCPRAPALLLGTDSPALTAGDLRTAAAALARDEVVVKPAEDGGYVLIGLRGSIPALFEAIPWGTDRVMAETRERIRRHGVACRELAPCWDVDRPADFERLLRSGLIPDLDSRCNGATERTG